MKLKTDSVCGERPTREPRPFDRAFALFDVLLGGPTLIVECDDVLGPSRQIRHDEADAREELTFWRFTRRVHRFWPVEIVAHTLIIRQIRPSCSGCFDAHPVNPGLGYFVAFASTSDTLSA
jgi:hypothetical protein